MYIECTKKDLVACKFLERAQPRPPLVQSGTKLRTKAKVTYCLVGTMILGHITFKGMSSGHVSSTQELFSE
jgi:hypothetical protein